MVLYSFNGWTQIVQVPVFRPIREISQPYQKNFRKPKKLFQGFISGHFTQVVWKESVQMGIAFAAYQDEGRHKLIVVANYYPVGNMEGAFEDNVKPPKAEEKKDWKPIICKN